MSTRNEKALELLKEAEKKHKHKPKAAPHALGELYGTFEDTYRDIVGISYNVGNKAAAFKVLKELLLGVNSDLEGAKAVVIEYITHYQKKYAGKYTAPSIQGLKYKFNEIYLVLQKKPARKKVAQQALEDINVAGGIQWL